MLEHTAEQQLQAFWGLFAAGLASLLLRVPAQQTQPSLGMSDYLAIRRAGSKVI